MSVANIALLAITSQKTIKNDYSELFLIAMAILAIFYADMLLKNCHKFNLEQLSHSMSVANVAIFIGILL